LLQNKIGGGVCQGTPEPLESKGKNLGKSDCPGMKTKNVEGKGAWGVKSASIWAGETGGGLKVPRKSKKQEDYDA